MKIIFFKEPIDLSSLSGDSLVEPPSSLVLRLKKIVCKYLPVTSEQFSDKTLTIDENALLLDGTVVPISEKNRKKLVREVIRLYDYHDQLPTEKPLDPVALPDALMSSGSFSGRVAGFAGTSSDSLTVVRHAFNSLFPSGAVYQIINQIGVISGTFWTSLSAYEIWSGYCDREKVKKIQDTEGMSRATAKIGAGTLGVLGALFYLAGKGVEIGADPLSITALGLNFASIGLLGATSVLALAVASAGIYRCSSFEGKLDEFLENAQLDETQKLRGAVKFLSSSIRVTAREEKELRATIARNNSGLDQGQIDTLLLEEMEKKKEAKINYLKRRSSAKTVRLLNTYSSQILEEIDSGNLKNAQTLIQVVKGEVFRKKALYCLTLLATIIGLLAYIGCVVTISAIFPYVMFGTSSAIMLAVALYGYYHKYKSAKEEANLFTFKPIASD